MSGDEGDRGPTLLRVARLAIAEALGVEAEAFEPRNDWLARPAASFVSLRFDGRLRGCIGSLAARRRLIDDLRSNARAAALGDPRFPPLAAEELPRTSIEVSLLTPLEEIPLTDEAALIAALRPLLDGVVLTWRGKRGIFLPQVWESLPEPAIFLRQLKVKAGLEEDFWSDELRAWRFAVEKWSEDGSGPAAV